MTIKGSFSNKTFTFVGNCNGHDDLATEHCVVQFSLWSYTWLTNWAPASRSYDHRSNWIPLSPITIINYQCWLIRCQVHVATSLTYKYNVDASKVVILSPYREQRSKISESLKKVYRCKNIPVMTIVKSQGKTHFLCFMLCILLKWTFNCYTIGILITASSN